MRDELTLQKALMQADRGDVAGAETTLRRLLTTSLDEILRVRVLVVLGDLLSGHDDQASRDMLAEAVELVGRIEDADDLIDLELDRARELLADG